MAGRVGEIALALVERVAVGDKAADGFLQQALVVTEAKIGGRSCFVGVGAGVR